MSRPRPASVAPGAPYGAWDGHYLAGHAYRPDLPPPTVKARRCLGCDTLFASTGPGNRVCDGCKKRDAWRDGVVFHGAGVAL